MVDKLIKASPRGFCAGVTRSIKTVEDVLELFGPPVYIKHAIVHNKTVIEDLEDKGAIIVESVKDIPEGAVAVFSAHGSPPEHFEQAKEKNIRVIDATCPLVTKVHFEMIKALENNYQPIYIGHSGHVEAEGVISEAKKFNKVVPIVETVAEVGKLELPDESVPIMVLTQTTFNVSKIREVIKAIRKKFDKVIEPADKDVCYATTNRQKVIAELAKKVDLVMIVGSKESSNSNRLVEVARDNGAEAILLDTVEEIKQEWFENKKIVGLSAGASAPEYRVQEIVDYFEKQGVILEELKGIGEKISFSEPVELKRKKKEIQQNIFVEFNKQKFDIDDDFIKKSIWKIVRELEGKSIIRNGQKFKISIAAVSVEEIKKINTKWRKVEEPTDVLSFCYDKDDDKIEGEIIFCPEIIKINAKKDEISFEEELLKNIIHSFLHIIGFEHSQKMFDLQNKILFRINNK